jgi:hypothetical protein
VDNQEQGKKQNKPEDQRQREVKARDTRKERKPEKEKLFKR